MVNDLREPPTLPMVALVTAVEGCGWLAVIVAATMLTEVFL